MAYPVISDADAAIIRSQNQIVRRGIVYAPREIIYSCQVDGVFTDPDSGGIYQFTFTDGDGDAGLTLEGMTVDVGLTPGGHEVGQMRLRAGANDVDHIIKVGETATGDVPLAQGMYISVINEYRIWQRRIRRVPIPPDLIDYTEYIDYAIAYGGENEDFYPPVANITRDNQGRPYKAIGFLDSGEDYRTIDICLLLSAGVVNPITGYFLVWYDENGDRQTSLSDTTQITVGIGFQWITGTVLTDTGATTFHRPIWTLSGWDDPMLITYFNVDSDQRGEGRSMSFTIGDSKAANVPQGTLMGYLEEAFFDGVAAPSCYIDQFYGWTTKESINLKYYRSFWKIDLGGTQTWLNLLNGYPYTVYDQRYPSSPTVSSGKFIEIPNNTPDKSVHYTLRIYTTAASLMNIFFSDYQPPIEGITTQDGKIWSQVAGITERYFGTAVCASDGSLWLRRHYSYLTDDEREATPDIITLGKADWPDDNAPELIEERTRQCAQVDVYGSNFDIVIAGSTLTDFSHIWRVQAPGIVRGDEGEVVTPPDLFLQTTASGLTQLKQLAGDHYARLNNKYPNIPIVLKGNMDVFEPGFMLPVRLIYTDSNSRNLPIDMEILVKSVSVEHSVEDKKQRKKISLTCEAVTKGFEGHQIDDVLQKDTTDEYPFSDRLPEYTVDTEPTRIIVFRTGDPGCHVGLEWSPELSVVDWQDASTGLLGGTIDATADTADYSRYFSLQSDSGDADNSGIYQNDSPYDFLSWSQIADYVEIFGTTTASPTAIMMSINKRGWMGIPVGANMFASSDDYGVTWNLARICGTADQLTYTGNGNVRVFAYPYSSDDNGVLWASTLNVTGAAGFRLHKSTDWGLTWTTINASISSSIGGSQPYNIHVPYQRDPGVANLDDGSLWMYLTCRGPNLSGIALSTNGGLTLTVKQSLSHGGLQYDMYFPPSLGKTGINTFTYDGNLVNTAQQRTFRMHSNKGSTLLYGTFSDLAGVDAAGAVQGYPIHSKALLYYLHSFSSPIKPIRWTDDAGATIHAVDAPAGYTGVAYAEWNIALLVPPAP